MRRPLKPFVTEYKQAGRRPTPQLAEFAVPEAERLMPKSVDLALKDSEDSYEAAMRAADALFSGAPRRALESPASSTTSPALPHDDTPKPEKNGGRILRVLDEVPLPQLVALEAEHAPKRRGRKPGSKNKPKIALTDEAQSFQKAAAAADARAITTPHLPSAPMPPAKIEATPAVPRRMKRDAPWIRDRLRPGEEWKRRRLPRVCW